MSRPQVSVIIATYNSSHLLRYALESLRFSDFQDWEAIVVGDHCTDDSEERVASLADERIRFLNLERNSGQQATPNNVGLGLARGTFISFLNHDDLFLPHHLVINLERMRSTDADLICCPYAEIQPGQLDRIDRRQVVARVRGFAPSGRFDPRRFHVASSWFMRREVIESVGPWRLERRTFVTPSQDWLFRAWRRGVRIHCPREISLIAIFSGERKNSYRERKCPEHDFVFREIVASDALRPALYEAVEASIRGEPVQKRASRRPRWRRRLARGRRRLHHALQSVLIRVGIHPNTPRMILRHGGRGGFIRHLKARTG